MTTKQLRQISITAFVAFMGFINPLMAAPAFWPVNGHYYQLVTNQLSWQNASAAASNSVYLNLQGYLATVTSQAENDFIKSLLQSDARGVRLGGTDAGTEGQWRWVTGESFNYTNWYTGEPNNSNGTEHYLSMLGPVLGSLSGYWSDHNDLSHRDIKHYVIEYSSELYNTNGTPQPEYNPANGHWYLLVTNQLSWADALNAAKFAVHQNMTGYLATITSQQENEFIENLFQSDARNIHLGGTDEGTEGNWRWITGEPFSYTNWYEGEPNNYGGPENYLAIHGPILELESGSWADHRGLSHPDTQHYIIEWGEYNSGEWLREPVLNPVNGHYYLIITSTVSWVEAVNAAQIPFNGMTGYLATVTTTQESQFITSLLGSDVRNAHLGGTDEGTEGTWRWITGEPFGFNAWYSGEPNNSDGNEDYIGLLGPMLVAESGYWSDHRGLQNPDTAHYIVEWGEYETQSFTLDRAYNPANGHWYLLITNQLGWSDAVLAAESMVYENMTGYLATVTSQQENDFIEGLLGPDVRSIHLGGTDEGTEGVWRWITGETFGFTGWYSGEPNNFGGPENYLAMLGPMLGPELGYWADHRGLSHPDTKHFVVEWGGFNSGEWLPEPVLNPVNGHYYLIITSTVSWVEAVNAAKIPFNSMTGYLATVTSEQESQFITSLLGSDVRNAHLGGTDEGTESVWRWITGEPFGFSAWYPGEPNNSDGNENYIGLLGPKLDVESGYWSDHRGLQHPDTAHYIVEWGEFETQSFTLDRAYNPVNGHWYLLVTNNVSWDYAVIAAQVVYEGMTGYLATVTSQQENEFISNLLQSDARNIHLGGTDAGSEGEWRWVTGESFTYNSWYAGEPNNFGVPENYLMMLGPVLGMQQSYWADGRGEQHPDTRHYVIEWGYYDSGAVQVQPVLNPANGHYYLVISNSVSWWQALLDARIPYNGMTGYLATVTSQQENEFITGLLSGTNRYVFLGGTDEINEGDWTWITGEPFSFSAWGVDEPDNRNGHENYLLMRGTFFGGGVGTWSDGYGSQSTHHKVYIVEWGGGFDTLSVYRDEERPDTDGDGVLDSEENEDGTNPYSSDSIFRGDVVVVDGEIGLEWRTVNGRCYRVQYRQPGPNSEWEYVSLPICETDEYPEGTERYDLDGDGPNQVGLYRIIWLRD